jgi:hypothetical protein
VNTPRVPIAKRGADVEQSSGVKADAGRRYRAYPARQQAGRLIGWGHTCRAVWNLALEQRQYLYRHRGVTLRAIAQGAQLTRARAELPWLADLPAQSAQQVLRQLDRAYDHWWNPQHPLAVTFPGQAVKVRKLNRKWAEVRLPKVGWVRLRLSRPLGGVVRNATVSHDGLGWHISFGVGSCARHLADVLGLRAPRPPLAAGLRAGVRLHRLRPPGARGPQRRTEHPTDCRRTGGRQHAQSPPGGKARTEPHA